MAEIHVERKRGTGAWLWVLLLVILVAAAVGYLWYAGYINLGMNAVPDPVLVAATSGGLHGT